MRPRFDIPDHPTAHLARHERAVLLGELIADAIVWVWRLPGRLAHLRRMLSTRDETPGRAGRDASVL